MIARHPPAAGSRRTVRILLAAFAATLLAGAAFAQPAAVSRYTRITDRGCREIPGPPGEGQEQFTGMHCPGFGEHRVWMLYGEGMYVRFGFGRIGNINGLFDADRNETWPVEWRGAVRRGRFVPYATIVRLRPPHQTGAGALVVFRLTADGRSCIIGEASGAAANERARAIADRLRAGPVACRQQSDPL